MGGYSTAIQPGDSSVYPQDWDDLYAQPPRPLAPGVPPASMNSAASSYGFQPDADPYQDNPWYRTPLPDGAMSPDLSSSGASGSGQTSQPQANMVTGPPSSAAGQLLSDGAKEPPPQVNAMPQGPPTMPARMPPAGTVDPDSGLIIRGPDPNAIAARQAQQSMPPLSAAVQAAAQRIAGGPPKMTSNWAQRLSMAVLSLGKLAPYAMQITHPQWTQQMNAYQQDEKDLGTLSTVQETQQRGNYFQGLESGRQEERRITAQGRQDVAQTQARQDTARREQNAFDVLTKGRTLVYRGPNDPVPQGWEPIPLANPALPGGWQAYAPSPLATVPKELLPYLPGYQEGETIDRDALERATKTYQGQIEKQATQAPQKPPGSPTEVLMNPQAFTPAQVQTAQKLFDQEHRDPNAQPGGVIAARNPSLPTDQRDEGILQGLSPADSAIVKQLVDYKYPMPSGMALRTPFWQKIIGAAAQYDPTFDASQYSNRQKLRNDFMSGKSSQSINALNTVAQHIGQMEQNWAALKNSGSPMWNAPINWIEQHVGGDPRMSAFANDSHAVADELMRVWRQTQGSDSEVKDWADQIGMNASPAQQQNITTELYKLIGGKLTALKSQYETGMGKPADFHMLAPEMAKRFQAHGVPPVDLAPGSTYGSSAQSYSMTATGPNGHKVGSNDGKAWFDIQTGAKVK